LLCSYQLIHKRYEPQKTNDNECYNNSEWSEGRQRKTHEREMTALDAPVGAGAEQSLCSYIFIEKV